MSRKKPKTINIEDEGIQRALKMAQICGAFTETQIKNYVSDYHHDELRRLGHIKTSNVRIKRATLKQMYAEGAITKEEYEIANAKKIPSITVETITPKCRRLCDKHLGLKDCHHSNSKLHDVLLTCKFQKLTEEEQASAIPEAQVRRELREAIDDMKKNDPERFQEILDKYEERLEGFIERFESEGGYASPTDFAYTSSTGMVMGAEVVTNGYSEFSICCKEFACDVLGYTYEEMKLQ